MTKHEAQTALAAFLHDPAASYFGKYVARHATECDPVDAATDLEYLAEVFSVLAKTGCDPVDAATDLEYLAEVFSALAKPE